MAARFDEAQLKGLQDALQDIGGKGAGATAPDTLPALAAALRGMPEPRPFGEGELAQMAAALDLVAQPPEERAAWAAAAPGREASCPRGLFIVFEGLDRSGKSTQSKELVKRLQERGPVRWTCFPERSTAIGSLIDLYLRRQLDLSDEVIHMLFCANRWEAVTQLIEDLWAGTSVVCDRYAFSGVAYSSAKGLDFEWCKALDIGLPAPDAVFFLRVDPTVGRSRANFGDERYENEELQAAVRKEFDRAELHAGVRWATVDGARSIEVIREEIGGAVDALQAPIEGPRPRLPPVAHLWA